MQRESALLARDLLLHVLVARASLTCELLDEAAGR